MARMPKDAASAERVAKAMQDGIEALSQVMLGMKSGKVHSLSRLLPAVFSLKGKPLTLNDHMPFRALYDFTFTRRMVHKTGRQVAKSTNGALTTILLSWIIPHLATLHLAPLSDQIRRFSNDYVRPFIKTSPVRHLFTSAESTDSVFSKTFTNGSRVAFNYGLLSIERVRGETASRISIDEFQDFNPDFIPVVAEVVSYGMFGQVIHLWGTPKTLENGLELEWLESDQQEWVIRCGCGKYNIPALDYDLDKMTGPYHPDIGKTRFGTVCAKCGNSINPATGRWVARYPDRTKEYIGRHIPQQILPHHYFKHENWKTLVGKRAGGLSLTRYYNEVCGESYDMGSRLVTSSDLKAVAKDVGPNKRSFMEKRVNDTDRVRYIKTVLGADWGGGGYERQSFTALAAMGMKANGQIEVFWGTRLLYPNDHDLEAKVVIDIMNAFNIEVLAHDFGAGSGSLRETIIHHGGMPLKRMLPMQYISASSGPMTRVSPATDDHPRSYLSVDKTRSIYNTCLQIKLGGVKFFDYDNKGKDDPGLLHDFLAIIDDKMTSRHSSDRAIISREPGKPDDFAQAVNFGVTALFHLTGRWPDYGKQIQTLRKGRPLDDVDPKLLPGSEFT